MYDTKSSWFYFLKKKRSCGANDDGVAVPLPDGHGTGIANAVNL